jgi:hypothetical protein
VIESDLQIGGRPFSLFCSDQLGLATIVDACQDIRLELDVIAGITNWWQRWDTEFTVYIRIYRTQLISLILLIFFRKVKEGIRDHF